MKLLTELDSLDNVKDGETRKLITKTTSSGSGNVVSSVSVSGDTITYTKGVTAVTDANYVHTDNNFTTTLKNKLDGIASGAEVNQNAFSNVKVGSTTIAADGKTDTLELAAGSNITLTPDATNDKVTIAATQPTVNNGTLTIQKNGTNVQTFTANQSSNVTANITVPTKTSDLTNDSGFLTSHQDISGKTNTSVMPNDNGEIKTKYRIANKNYTGSNSTIWYYPLCELPTDGDGNYASLILSGRIGGWVNSNMSYINALAWNRSGTGISLFDIAGGASNMSDIWNICDIVIYTDAKTVSTTANDGGIDTVYLKCKSYFTFDLDIELFQSTARILYNGNYITTTPTGTLVAQASTSTKRAELINGKLYIAGNELALKSAIPTKVSQLTNDSGYTSNTGTITKVQANGTDIASSGTANIPAASTSAYGVTKLSDATNSTSTTLAATANAVKKAYDLANTANTGLTNKLDIYNGEVEAPAEGTINWHNGTLEASSYDNFDNYAQFQLYKDEINLMVNNDSDGITELSIKPSEWTSLTQKDTDNISSAGFSIKNDEVFLSTNNNDDEHSTYIQIKEANQSIYLYGNKLQVSQAPTTDLGIANKKYVDDAISALPEPMVFKGSLGTGGTITSLPTAAATNEGHTYKVITAGTYASQAAKAGDTFVCAKTGTNTYAWTLIPSGDEPSGTVTSVTLKATSPIAIDSTSAITTSGTRTLSHANSGVTAGTYRSVTVNATGHVTAGTNPTTLSGYGITDAKIASGVITLGSNTITPLTAASTLDATKLSGTIPSGCYTDTKNTAGSTDSSSKLFLIGATSQAANPQTYSQDTAYVGTDGKLYSNSKEVVNLSDTQALTNKTYNGYTLAAASAKGVVTTVDTSANLPTSNAVKTFVEGKNYNYSIEANSGTGTIDDLAAYTSGKPGMTGSINITKKSSGIGSEIAAGWYNFIFSPHRTGSGGDNTNYGNIILMPMTGSGTSYILRRTSSATAISEVKPIITTDTKNTAGSTDTSSKIFLIGATSQAANSQTYSDNEVYATSGVLTTKSVQVGGTAATMQYNSTDKCIEFIFT